MIAREFDFSEDYRLLNQLGQAYVERSKLERGESRLEARESFQRQAVALFNRALELDPENAQAHYNLALLYKQLGEREQGDSHLAFYRTYKADDNARDRAIAIHRAAHPAADHAAEAIVIYDLRREGSYELDGSSERKAAAFELSVGSAELELASRDVARTPGEQHAPAAGAGG
jgi:tetratricopeptide (TPR) repeat protein